MQVPLLVENHTVRARTENGHSNQSIINLHHHLSSYYLTLVRTYRRLRCALYPLHALLDLSSGQ
jgi:hypothetical protein